MVPAITPATASCSRGSQHAAGFTVHVLALVAPSAATRRRGARVRGRAVGGAGRRTFRCRGGSGAALRTRRHRRCAARHGLDAAVTRRLRQSCGIAERRRCADAGARCPERACTPIRVAARSAFRATVTMTFLGLKQGLFLGAAADHCGELEFADLDLPREAATALTPTLQAARGGGSPHARCRARARRRTKARAAGCCSSAAGPACRARSGSRPRLLCASARDSSTSRRSRDSVATVLCRPAGNHLPWQSARRKISRTFARVGRRGRRRARPRPVGVGAWPVAAARSQRTCRWSSTPTRSICLPAEPRRAGPLAADAASRGGRAAARQSDRRRAARPPRRGARSLVATDAIAVLKGAEHARRAGAAASALRVCDRGNPGMATGGMGDVLAGTLGALLVQTGDLASAACAGVLLHALAGDAAAKDGERGTLAGDLLPASYEHGRIRADRRLDRRQNFADLAGVTRATLARRIAAGRCVVGLARRSRLRQDDVGARDAARARVTRTRAVADLYAARAVRRRRRCTIVHLDLYRLRGEDELEHLGLRDWLAEPARWIAGRMAGAGAAARGALRPDARVRRHRSERPARDGDAGTQAWNRSVHGASSGVDLITER